MFRQLLFLRRSYEKRLLLIEGAAAPCAERLQRRLRGVITKITVGLQIPIVMSQSLSDSALYIQRAAIQLAAINETTTPIKRIQKPAGLEFQQVFFLAGIPGVGVKRARSLLSQFGSLSAVLQADEAALCQAPGIGPKFAREIVTLLKAAYQTKE